MNSRVRYELTVQLDDELLKGSVLPSGWCSALILEADNAFVAGAFLAALLTAMAGVEAQLRFDYSESKERLNLSQLIEQSTLPADLKAELQELRRIRNRWVHVSDPWSDRIDIAEDPQAALDAMEPIAARALIALREAFYAIQGT